MLSFSYKVPLSTIHCPFSMHFYGLTWYFHTLPPLSVIDPACLCFTTLCFAITSFIKLQFYICVTGVSAACLTCVVAAVHAPVMVTHGVQVVQEVMVLLGRFP